jgi:hypothetical protein
VVWLGAFELGADGVVGCGEVPLDVEEVGFAADLAVFDVLLAAACGFVDDGVVPLSATSALEACFVRHGVSLVMWIV